MISTSQRASGGLRELILLFFPIAITTSSNCLFLLVEKLLLARLSIHEMEAAVNATYAWQIFQGSCIALAMAAQVYVGRCWGAQNLKAIGPGIWQFIWFSLLSVLVTTPLGVFYGAFYFQGTEIENRVLPYYYFLLSINFLYPLATALTSFYISQGKTRLVVWTTLVSQVIKILLAYILILGVEGWVAEKGLMGGAISTLIAQGGLCLVLFCCFLNSKHVLTFDSRAWRFQPKLFWECIYPGLLRALCRILTFLSWATIAGLMTVKGGNYLLVLSIGGALFLFFPFLADAIFQAQTTIVSQILGRRDYHLLSRAFRSGTMLVLGMIGLFSMPLLTFPSTTLHYLFAIPDLGGICLNKVFFGVWLSFAFFTFVFVPIGFVMAFKDANFFLFMGLLNWINGYLLMYVAIERMDIAADLFWLVLSLMHASTALIYYWRMRWLISKMLHIETFSFLNQV